MAYYDMNGYEMEPRFYDLNGNPVERTPWSHPYAYDEFVVYKAENFDEGNSWVYSDRMLQWDREKYGDAFHKVWPGKSGSQMFHNRKPEDINQFLNLYFEKKVTLTAVLQGCNVSTGYPYWIFAYKE